MVPNIYLISKYTKRTTLSFVQTSRTLLYLSAGPCYIPTFLVQAEPKFAKTKVTAPCTFLSWEKVNRFALNYIKFLSGSNSVVSHFSIKVTNFQRYHSLCVSFLTKVTALPWTISDFCQDKIQWLKTFYINGTNSHHLCFFTACPKI